MKLKSFRIKNFRSIVDSGWCDLSNDNITALIGQNESGKTSVLEALHSFFNGNISEDVLRSDLSLPEVNCSMDLNETKIEDIIDLNKIPQEAVDIFKKLETVCISRTWDELFNSHVHIEEKNIINFFQDKEKEKHKELSEAQKQINKIASNNQKLKVDKNNFLKEKEQLISKIGELKSSLKSQKKIASKSRKEKNRAEAAQKVKELENQLKESEDKLQKTEKELNTKQIQIETNEKKENLANKVKETDKFIKSLEKEVSDNYQQVKETEATFNLFNKGQKRRNHTYEIDEKKNKYLDSRKKLNEKIKEHEFWLRIARKILDNVPYDKAEKEVHEQFEKEKQVYAIEELGTLFFEKAPVFEFFHDFSSLLPDRIDLEDVIFGKEDIKGYKAVKNYLKVANLNPQFFDQQNSRILKQKIEKLNRKITIDFHEYWRQSIGNENKIQISFELEHYDHNTPEKLGKPYIEFWIKDKDERLYPKQRSRGVRWFLSFYLELKAFAMTNNRNRVLLIDEPAMSLHARAQEDVLKVFEDIRKDLQVIYTTHSPHLVDINKLYRVRALQRKDENGYNETFIFNTNSCKYASSDTLSPIYSLMGERLNEQQFIQKENNVILEDIATYYYLTAIAKITGLKSKVYFLPASDIYHVTTLTNLLLGWKLGFIVILGNNKQGVEIYKHFKHHLFQDDEDKTNKNIMLLNKGQKHIEDIFSTIDFKKHILNKRVGITESNSDYIKNNNLSRSILASDFLSRTENKKLSIEDFDDETQKNLNTLVSSLDKMLNHQGALVK